MVTEILHPPAAGSGWKLVRHVPASAKAWHPATDQLRGTDVYGDPSNPNTAWSITFNKTSFNQFLFATGDGEKWLITTKEQVTGSFYENEDRQILKSSKQNSPYTVKWYRRKDKLEDPWVSLSDHAGAIGSNELVYGENRFIGNRHVRVLEKHNGANVFIRFVQKGEYKSQTPSITSYLMKIVFVKPGTSCRLAGNFPSPQKIAV